MEASIPYINILFFFFLRISFLCFQKFEGLITYRYIVNLLRILFM